MKSNTPATPPDSAALETPPLAAELDHWMFESSPDCTKLLDPQGRLLAMNRNGQHAMEIDDFGRLLGMPWSSLWPEESRGPLQVALEAAREGGVGHFSAFCPTAKGTPRWWDVRVTAVWGREQRVERLLSVSRDVTELYRSQQELRETAARLQFVLDAAEIGDWGLDLGSNAVRRSLRHDQCFGYDEPVEDWSLDTFLGHVHPQDRESVRRELDAAMAGRKDARFECRVVRGDGSVHWISAHGSLFRTEGGPPRLLGIVSDITPRKRVEALARGQQRAFELHAEGAPLPEILEVLARASEESAGGTLLASILLLDGDGRHLRSGAGPSLPASYNAATDGIPVGPSVGSCGTAAHLGQPVICGDIETDPRWDGLRELVLPHGLRACWSMPICSTKGRVLGTLASYCREAREPSEQERESMSVLVNTAALILQQRREAQEREAAEVALHASEERARLAAGAAGLGVWTWRPATGQVTWENERPWEILGLPPSDEPFDAVRFGAEGVHPDDRDRWQQAWTETARFAVPLSFEGRFRRADGTLRWIELAGRPQPRAPGAPMQVVGIMADITGRKQAEEDLRRLAEDLAEADRRKTEFLATLAHELRNPLAPIRTGLEILRLSNGNPAAAARTREMMERQLSHMVHLVDDLLDVARITRGKLELRKERTDLRCAVSSAIETSLPLIEAGCHALSVHVPEQPLPLDADPIRIAQVVSNLLNNAAKYTPAGGRIELSVRQEGGDVRVCVTDSGVGLPAEALETVFQMFSQIRHSADRAQGGLGIGLTLVRRLVELHGGTVSVSSPGVGRGSTFTFRLPLAQVERPGEPAGSDAADKGGDAAQGLRVLIADDNADAAETLSALVGMVGHATAIANDGPEALRRVPEFRPDVVILDIGMPGMDGYEVAQALRKFSGMERVLLIALTGWGGENDRARSREAGFDHHMTKPADLGVLNRLLSERARALEAARS